MGQRAPRFLHTLDTVTRVLTKESLLSEDAAVTLKNIREAMLPNVSAARHAYSAAERDRFPTDWVTA